MLLIPYRYFLLLLALVAAIPSLAESDADLVVTPGEYVFCTTCHGIQLMGNQEIDAPRLSGMDAWYIERQLQSFRNGWRGTHADDFIGMEMRPMAQALDEEQVSAVAEFVSQTKSPRPEVTIAGDAEAGKQHFTACAACHGTNAEGNQVLGAPALTGLNDWYLVHQLQLYRSGVRGSNPADTFGVQMRASAQLLGDDKAINDVVSYITQLPTN